MRIELGGTKRVTKLGFVLDANTCYLSNQLGCSSFSILHTTYHPLLLVLYFAGGGYTLFACVEQVTIPSQRRYVGYWGSTLSFPRGFPNGPPDVNLPQKCSRELLRVRLYDTINTNTVFFVVLELQKVSPYP